MNSVATATPPAPPPAVRKRRVLLVDDHPIVRQGLARLIDEEPDLMVCGQAEDVRTGSAAVGSLRPDVAVVDLSLRESDGLDLIKLLRQRHPALPVLVLSIHNESLHAERTLRAGARGYVMKQEATEKVMGAIRTVLAGEVHLSPRMAARIVSRMAEPRGGGAASAAGATPRADVGLESLTDREFEVFSLIGQGLGPTAMAGRLSVSVKTIEGYRENIKAKLKLKDGHALLRAAVQYAMGERITHEEDRS